MVAVVIPCRNEARTLPALLDALARQDRVPDEVIIVDDHSTDASIDVAQAWAEGHPGVTLRVMRNRGRESQGAGAALNVGIAATRADVIVRLDGHAVPSRQYVSRGVAALEATGAGVVGGVWVVAPLVPTPVAQTIAVVVRHPLGTGGARYRHPHPGGPLRREVETVPFGIFRRETWATVGGFDESLSANQDFDFNYRVRRLGMSVMLDQEIVSTYHARSTLSGLWRQYGRYGYFKRRMLAKDWAAIHWRQVVPILLWPWLLGTLALALIKPGLASAGLITVYPAVLAVSAWQVHRAGGRWGWAVLAFLVVHLAWSGGFWRSLLVLPGSSRT